MGMAAAAPSEAMEPANSKETAANGVESALVGGNSADSSSLKRKRDKEIGEEEEEETVPGSRDGSVKRDPYWKTSLCSYYRSQRGGAGCSHGDACRYAHGEAELRPRPDNTWDPTSERAKTLKAESDAKVESLEAEDQAEAVDLSSLDKCLIGLPKKWSSDSLKSFLDGQGVLYETARKKKGMTVGFICFENVQQLKDAIKVLNENSACANKKIKVADAIRRPYDKKSEMKNSSNQTKELGENELCTNDAKSLVLPCSFEGDDEVGKDICIFEGLVSKTRTARDVVTPLADMPYVDQLDQKKNSLMQTLKKLTRNARKACPSSVALPEWIIKSRENGGLPCKFEAILESPLTNGYRNKCEFSVGYSLLGKPTVGFMVGTFREGITAIEEPINCPNVSRIASEFALIFQEFLQSSMLPVWNRIENKGFWRQFTVREGRKPCLVPSTEHAEIQIAEVMLIVQICSSDIDEDVQKTEFQRMVQALALGAAACSPPLPLTVIVLQDYKGISNAAPADCPLIPLMVPDVEGQLHSENKNAIEARIHDYISNLRFSISPTAFFQVNTLAAERLYSLAGDWADLNPDTLLFDICCGTGTIGLTLAHHVGMVVGIEMNASAVSDAQRNAAINGIKNCRFICSKAEDIMGALLKEYLDVPEQPPVASDVSRISCTDNYERITCEAKLEGPVDGKLSDSSMAVDDGQENDLNDSAGTEGNCAAGYSDITEDKQICKEPFQDTPTSEDKDGEGIPQFKNVVAIVDPPRVGLHPMVIKVLRTHPRIRRLIYISCNPESLVANAIELCTPTADEPGKAKGNRGWRKMSSAGLARLRTKSMPKSAAFQPVRAMAVDMFPHTQHCEMVMLLER